MTLFSFFHPVALFAVFFLSSNAFIPTRRFHFAVPLSLPSCRYRWSLQALPSLQDLKNDGFMQQISHAVELINLIDDPNTDQSELTEMIKAQLSHSNGIRGFFANYLTMDGPADLKQVPKPVLSAMSSIEDQSDLVSLSCMNVIMPTAMSTMHDEAELQENSRKTAMRGIKILLALHSNAEVGLNAKAIHAAATRSGDGDDSDANPALVKYWTRFFDNYGYKEQQQKDIAEVMKQFL